MSQAPEGIHEAEVTDWMVAHLPEISTPLTFTLIAGGRSNLTFRVEDADGTGLGPAPATAAPRAARPHTTCPASTG